MGLMELFFIALGLSADAFAVSTCIGLSIKNKKSNLDETLKAGLYFGISQAVMPVIGYFAAAQFADRISNYSGYIAFGILAFIGGKMIKESFDKSDKSDKPENQLNADLGFKKMFPLAVATSIDALAVGVTFALRNVSILPAAGFIGITTFLLAAAGVKIGGILGMKFKSKAEFAGGLVLLLMGVKILLEHLEIF
jgi:putative Mn2+ efflux pump MntP